jgi:hypothetical protein
MRILARTSLDAPTNYPAFSGYPDALHGGVPVRALKWGGRVPRSNFHNPLWLCLLYQFEKGWHP